MNSGVRTEARAEISIIAQSRIVEWIAMTAWRAVGVDSFVFFALDLRSDSSVEAHACEQTA